MRVTQPFDASTMLSIDPELCRRVDSAQDREPAERPFDFTQNHELVEWQMGVFRPPLNQKVPFSPSSGQNLLHPQDLLHLDVRLRSAPLRPRPGAPVFSRALPGDLT
jgi:hypothetical protein